MITVHELKIQATMFNDVALGKKTAELRLDDRNFRVGDFLVLKKLPAGAAWHENDLPTEVVCRISHIVKGGYGLKSGYVMLSLKLVSRAFMVRTLASTPS